MAMYTCVLFNDAEKELPKHYHVQINFLTVDYQAYYTGKIWEWNGTIADGRAVIELPEKDMALKIWIYYEKNWLDSNCWIIRGMVHAGNIYSITEKIPEKNKNNESSLHRLSTTVLNLARRISEEITPAERAYQVEKYYMKFETHLGSNKEKDYYNYGKDIKNIQTVSIPVTQQKKITPLQPLLTPEQEEKRRRKAEKRRRQKQRKKERERAAAEETKKDK